MFRFKVLSLLSLGFILVAGSIWGLWIYIFNSYPTQAERTSVFSEYFPNFLQDSFAISLLGILLCVLAIILSSAGLKLHGKSWRIFNILLIVSASLLLLLNLTSML